jgi:hypothetical protein
MLQRNSPLCHNICGAMTKNPCPWAHDMDALCDSVKHTVLLQKNLTEPKQTYVPSKHRGSKEFHISFVYIFQLSTFTTICQCSAAGQIKLEYAQNDPSTKT